jgi:hypothetical protein
MFFLFPMERMSVDEAIRCPARESCIRPDSSRSARRFVEAIASPLRLGA